MAGFRSHPKNIPMNLDLVGLRKFAKELGLPVYRGVEAPRKYTALYQKLEHSDQGGGKGE